MDKTLYSLENYVWDNVSIQFNLVNGHYQTLNSLSIMSNIVTDVKLLSEAN